MPETPNIRNYKYSEPTMSKWQVKTYEWVIDVVPLDDLKEHLMADECWYAPKTTALEELLCSDNVWRPQMLFTHNAADRREKLIAKVKGKLGGK